MHVIMEFRESTVYFQTIIKLANFTTKFFLYLVSFFKISKQLSTLMLFELQE